MVVAKTTVAAWLVPWRSLKMAESVVVGRLRRWRCKTCNLSAYMRTVSTSCSAEPRAPVFGCRSTSRCGQRSGMIGRAWDASRRRATVACARADRAVSAADDEARWLSAEEPVAAGPVAAPHLASASVRTARVYGLEAE